MARIVKRTQKLPYKLVIGGEEKWICRCGLSRDQPFCDGSHALAKGEQEGVLYWYDEAGERHEMPGDLPGIRAF